MTYMLSLDKQKIERKSPVGPIGYINENNIADKSGYLVPFLTQQSQSQSSQDTDSVFDLEEADNRLPSTRNRLDTETIYI